MNEQINQNDVYVPFPNENYPDTPDKHILESKKLYDVVVDENYPFLDKSFKFQFMMNLQYLGIFTLVFFLNPIKYGLRIVGKKNIKKNRKLLKNGAITISNHVYRWDFLGILQAVKYRKLYFPAWKENLSGKDRNLIRFAGGIPVPETFSAMGKFNESFDELYQKKKWLHIFPEASRWDYYQPIRPFKKGAFTFAQKYNRSVIPMVYTYRKPNKIESFFTGGKPCFTLNVGEPLLPNQTLSKKQCVYDLRKRTFDAMVEMAGIKQNCWPCEGD